MPANPLSGAHVVVARSEDRGESLCQRILEAGGEALAFSVIDIRALPAPAVPDETPDLVIFASVAAVENGLSRLREYLTSDTRVAAIGTATADALAQASVNVDLVPERHESEGLLATPEFNDVSDRNAWIVRGRGGRELLPQALRDRGARVHLVEVYERVVPSTDITPLLQRWRNGQIDAIVVGSRAGLENLHAMLNAEGRGFLRETQLVMPTERMLKLALELDIRPAPVIADGASDEAFLAALLSWWATGRSTGRNTSGFPMSNDDQHKTPGGEPADRTAETKPPVKAEAAEKNSAGQKKPKPDKTRREGKSSGKGGRIFGLLVLLVLLGAIGAGGWYAWQWLETERAAYQATMDAQARELDRLQAQIEQLEETRAAGDELNALDERVGGAVTRLQDRVDRVANDMEALRDAAQGGRRDLLESEIEYLLRLAADELYLTQDVDTAIYALQTADDRLRQLGDPRLMPVRRLIADHLKAMRAVNLPDVSGMALKTGSLMREVSELPLRQAEHARAVGEDGVAERTDGNWWERIQAGVTRLFDKLVVVQRAEPPAPLLTPEEHFFLFRNVELQLAAARAALLAGDMAAYRQSLELAREWLNRYFDTSDAAVQSTIADVNGLLGVSLQPSLPDITPALERFRSLTRNGARSE